MGKRYVVVIVLPDGSEFDPGNAPSYRTLGEAKGEALDLALTLDLLGDRGSVVVRDRETGSVEATYSASFGRARELLA